MSNERIIHHFEDCLERHGPSFRALDWGSRESQELRFRVLAEIGCLAGKSVLDVGCGLGDFYGFLRENGIAVNYRGVDITQAMVERAGRRYPEIQVERRDIVRHPLRERFDYVMASGIFYLLRDEEEVWRLVREMFRLARYGVACNSLSSWGRVESGELALEPASFLGFCRTLTGRLALRHDYLKHDFTVYLYKERE